MLTCPEARWGSAARSGRKAHWTRQTERRCGCRGAGWVEVPRRSSGSKYRRGTGALGRVSPFVSSIQSF